MIFSSFEFLFVFLPLVLLGYFLIPKKQWQLVFLLIASTVFYMYWSFGHVFILFFTVCLDFYLARWIANQKNPARRKRLLVLSIAINLSILGFFKYSPFLMRELGNLLVWFGMTTRDSWPVWSTVLPIGISFYTFQSMSYVIDVYRKVSSPHPHLLPFVSYVTLFPHQISGPLVRHNTIVPQLEAESTYQFNWERFALGIQFFVIGMSKKILIADRLAVGVDGWLLNLPSISGFEGLLASLGFTLQLYFDFSGYSDMAVGLGHMMNIQFPQNFNSPYQSRSITQFWQNWHITLSSWLRDYLYISLGGNRKGSLITYRNLFLTMVIGGFWHGANWTFIIWGAWHGGLLLTERAALTNSWTQKLVSVLPSGFKQLYCFFAVSLGWIYFRADSVTQAHEWILKIGTLVNQPTWDLMYLSSAHRDRFFLALTVGLLIVIFGKNSFQWSTKWTPLRVVYLVMLTILSFAFFGEESPFLYFQF